jgi:CO/xanthine dehydrogenase Mo-binding subunit
MPTAVDAIGTSPPRTDGPAKVTGAALYVDDIDAPDALHGRTVRSACAHGVLRAIRLDPAFDWSDVVVVTAQDIPGKNVVALIVDDQPCLVAVGQRIRHWDEAVALVAAPTKAKAAAALKAITLDVEPLPTVLTTDEALAGKVLLGDGDTNVFKEILIEQGDVEAALAKADVVIEGTYVTGAQEQMYIEPQGMLARWDGPDDAPTCRVIGSLQCPYYVHKALKVLLGLPDHRVVITQATTGGGFGGKEEYPSMIAGHAALLSRKARRPVKVVYERDEDVAATTKRHPAFMKSRMGLLRDGTIVAHDVDVVMDGGAYVTLSPVVLSRGVLHAAGPYKIANVRVRGRAVLTNHPPHGAFRGFGAPQTTFAYERQVAKACRALKLDPLVLRRKNMLREGDHTATGQKLTISVGSVQVMDALEAQLAKAPPTNPQKTTHGGGVVKRGRGVAFYFHGAGFTGSGEARMRGQATLAVARDGRFEVRTSSTDIGQGMLTIFQQIAAAALGVECDQVRVPQACTADVPDSGPTVASRTCMVVGSVVEQASKALKKELETWGRGEGLATDDLVRLATLRAVRKGELTSTVTYSPPPGIVWDDATYRGDAYPCYGWAACAVDVAVDEDTHEVTVERCVHVVDVGKAIHPRIVQGQIEGGTLQALGWALWESVQYQGGRVLNQRMTNCIIPTSIEAPEMETVLVEVPYPFGPRGAKGVGEIPMDGPAAAVANAVEAALGGVPIDEVLFLPEGIQRARRAHGRGR